MCVGSGVGEGEVWRFGTFIGECGDSRRRRSLVVFLCLVVVVCFEVWFDLAVPDAHS